MKRYSVLINWCDGDREQGDFAWSGLALDEGDAELKAREAMASTLIAERGDDAESFDDTNDVMSVGGSLIAMDRGAIWQAQELEDALRGLLKAADETAARNGWSDHGEREAARKLLNSLDQEG